MKRNLFLGCCLLLGLFMAIGQEGSALQYLNFKTEQSSRVLIWEYIDEVKPQEGALISNYETEVLKSNNLTNYSLTESTINGSMEEVYMPGSGLPINFSYAISFKENRYRIQITKIVIITSKTSINGYSFGDTPLENWALNMKGTKFKKGGNITSILNSMDDYFKGLFVYKEKKDTDDDW